MSVVSLPLQGLRVFFFTFKALPSSRLRAPNALALIINTLWSVVGSLALTIKRACEAHFAHFHKHRNWKRFTCSTDFPRALNSSMNGTYFFEMCHDMCPDADVFMGSSPKRCWRSRPVWKSNSRHSPHSVVWANFRISLWVWRDLIHPDTLSESGSRASWFLTELLHSFNDWATHSLCICVAYPTQVGLCACSLRVGILPLQWMHQAVYYNYIGIVALDLSFIVSGGYIIGLNSYHTSTVTLPDAYSHPVIHTITTIMSGECHVAQVPKGFQVIVDWHVGRLDQFKPRSKLLSTKITTWGCVCLISEATWPFV